LAQVRGYYLLLTVERSGFSKIREEDWPSPSLVGKIAEAGLEEFSERLVVRNRGDEWKPENLIPATVAYLLRNSRPVGTEIEGRKEIHRLLNEHVLCEVPWKGRLAEKNYADDKMAKQLWRDVKKIKQMEDRVPDRGPYEIM